MIFKSSKNCLEHELEGAERRIKVVELSIKEVEVFANRKGVRKIAVRNFLMSMGNNYFNARMNLELDAKMYEWNVATIKAIRDGINSAERGDKE